LVFVTERCPPHAQAQPCTLRTLLPVAAARLLACGCAGSRPGRRQLRRVFYPGPAPALANSLSTCKWPNRDATSLAVSPSGSTNGTVLAAAARLNGSMPANASVADRQSISGTAESRKKLPQITHHNSPPTVPIAARYRLAPNCTASCPPRRPRPAAPAVQPQLWADHL
jgi:hypothetical protein